MRRLQELERVSRDQSEGNYGLKDVLSAAGVAEK
jgi:hypothetical protein